MAEAINTATALPNSTKTGMRMSPFPSGLAMGGT
jgi:hypothetical protein